MSESKLTEGNISKGIVGFLTPILISSLIQQLYSTVDLILIGRYVGAEATAAVGASALIITCLIGFFNGMAVGSNVVTAHIFGRADSKDLKKVIQTVWITGTVGGLALMVCGLVLAPIFLHWMNTPTAILVTAVNYLRIYMLCMPGIILYNLCSGILRAMGDSKNPMLFQIVGGVLNVAGDILLVAFFNKGVEGAAAATFVSQTVAAGLILIHLHSKKRTVRLHFGYKDFSLYSLKKIMLIGIPSGIQAIIITFSIIIIQSQINKFGVPAIAAFTTYYKVEMLLYLPIVALGQAVISFVGQNHGAAQHDRIRQGTKFAVMWGIGMTAAISALLLLNGEFVMRLFSDNEKVISYGCQIMMITFPFYFLYAIFECLNCEIRGKGNARIPMLITVFSLCVVRLAALGAVLKIWQDVRGIAAVYPFSWGIAVILLIGIKYPMRKKEETENRLL